MFGLAQSVKYKYRSLNAFVEILLIKSHSNMFLKLTSTELKGVSCKKTKKQTP